MNIKTSKMSVSNFGKLLFGAGNLFLISECVVLFFFLSYSNLLGLRLAALIPICLFALILPVVLMPLFYAVINGSTRISSGRYHMPLVICAMIAALANMLLFSLSGFSVLVTGILVFVFLFTLSLCTQIFFYTYHSLETRMYSDKLEAISNVFSLIAVIVFALLCFWLYKDSSSIASLSYMASTIMVIAVVCIYMGSYTHMPYFIRLEPTTIRTVKSIYSRYFTPLKHRPINLSMIGSALILSGIFVFCGAFPYIATISDIPTNSLSFKFLILAFAVMLCYSFVFKYLFKNKSYYFSKKTNIIGCSVIFAGVIMLLFNFLSSANYFHLSTLIKNILCFISIALVGLASGLIVSTNSITHSHIVAKTKCTSGSIYSLEFAMKTIAFAIALSFGMVAVAFEKIMEGNMLLCTIITIVLLLVAGLTLSCLGVRRVRAKKED